MLLRSGCLAGWSAWHAETNTEVGSDSSFKSISFCLVVRQQIEPYRSHDTGNTRNNKTNIDRYCLYFHCDFLFLFTNLPNRITTMMQETKTCNLRRFGSRVKGRVIKQCFSAGRVVADANGCKLWLICRMVVIVVVSERGGAKRLRGINAKIRTQLLNLWGKQEPNNTQSQLTKLRIVIRKLQTQASFCFAWVASWRRRDAKLGTAGKCRTNEKCHAVYCTSFVMHLLGLRCNPDPTK